jgi:peptidoglycan/LPS O-acetylase OafA/YrhL
MVSFFFAVILLLVVLQFSNHSGLFLQTPMFVFTTTFFGHFFEFFSGIALALIIMQIEKRDLPKETGIRWTLAGSIGILLLIVHMMYVYAHPPLNAVAIIVSGNFLIPVPVAVLYYGLIREKTWVAQMLSGKTAELLGRSSYSFYLLHTIVIQYVSLPLLPTFFDGHRKTAVIVTLIGTYLLSILLFACYEEPISLFLRRTFLSRRKADSGKMGYSAIAGNTSSG